MSLGIFVMGIIILIAGGIVLAVFYYGAKHDPHTSIRSAESSLAVQTLAVQAEETHKALSARQQAFAEAEAKRKAAEAEAAAKKETTKTEKKTPTGKKKSGSALGDEDAKAKRRAAALARKAAREAQQNSEG